ncbi:putative bifunctional diguanylate cyclase/phosphodiesterase [Halalkalibacterium ligniniphilum]|uniref:putative bifunctional diguanylate cyclase/phosphodiesterase n=1 Tax=Halalkalibacterium ligniniphilum TaxID=1134413 RepID=UPI000346260C|nr:EAL domain-containing protein [Halalkalibacterium ligniniphilum]
MDGAFSRFAKDEENVWKLFSQMNDALMLTDANNRIIAINPAFEKITGYSFAEAEGKNPSLLKSGETETSVYKALWQEINENGTWSGEIINKRKNGEIFWAFITVTKVDKEQSEDCFYIGVMRDVTEQKMAEKQMSFLAFYDGLTQLSNRYYFMEQLQERLSRYSPAQDKAAFLFFDLDRFKKINDSYGHNAGDELLIDVARRLHEAIGDRGIVSRFGGDEFTAILPDLKSKEEVYAIIDEVFSAFEQPFYVAGTEHYMTTSIGVSFYPEHGIDGDTLLTNADRAMYETKRTNRNSFHVYHPQLNQELEQELLLGTELRQAIQHDELEVYYQLQVNVQNGKVYGVEAFVRWNHPERGLLLPESFLSAAKETGLIKDIDLLVLNRACQQVRAWHQNGHDQLMASVNISKAFFQQQSFVQKVEDVLVSSGITPAFLCLEMEKFKPEELEESAEKLLAVRKLGVHVSLEDFGTDYSHLNRMKAFPVDALKFNQSLVPPEEPVGSAVAKLILGMAKSLNVSVICQGVETEEQLTLIRNEGCEHTQGHLFSKPLSFEKCAAMLHQMKSVIEKPVNLL